MAQLTIADLLIRLAAESSGVDEFNAKLAATKANLIGAEAGIKDLNATLKDLDTAGQSVASSVNRSFNSIESIVTRMAIRTAVMDTARLVVSLAGAFEEAEAKITSATGAIGADLDKFTDGLRSVADSSGLAADQVGAAMGRLSASLHLDPGPSLTALTKEVTDLAIITGEKADQIAGDTAKLIKAFNIDPSQMGEALNRLLSVAQSSSITIKSLESDLQKYAGLFNELGVPLDNAAQFIGRLNDAGKNVPAVLQSMQTAMTTLAKDGAANLTDAMSILFDKIRNAPNDTAAFDIAAVAFKHNAAEMATGIRDGTIALEDMKAPLDATGASIANQAKSVESLAQKWQQFKNQLESGVLGQAITADFKNELNDIESIANAMGRAATFAANLGNAIKTAFTETFPVLATALNYWEKLGGSPGTASTDATSQTTVTRSGGSIAVPAITGPVSAGVRSTDLSAVDRLLNGLGGSGTNKLPTDPEFQLLQRQVKILREQVTGAKTSFAALSQELGDLLDIMINMPDVADLNQELARVSKSIADRQAAGLPVDSDVFSKLSALNFIKASAGMDQASSQKLLGLPNPDDVRNNARLIEQAFEEIQKAGTYAPGYIALAWADASDKIIADMRRIGDQVSAADVLANDLAHTAERLQNMDFGQARSLLGITTVAQAGQAAQIGDRAASIIGAGSPQDASNATIANLEQQAAAAKKVGVAFDDLKQSQLDYLRAVKDTQALNTEGAFSVFGMKSQADLDNLTLKLRGAFAVLEDSGSATATQLLVANFKDLATELDALRASGLQVTNDFFLKYSDAAAAAALATNDLGRSIGVLGVLTEATASHQIVLLSDSLDRIKAQFTAESAEFLTGAIALYTKETALLQAAGKAVPAQLTADLDALKAKLIGATQTLDQAYQSLGLTSSAAAEARLMALGASLKAIQADANASEFTLTQASTAYWTQYYQTRINLGEDFDKKDKALNDLVAERIRLVTSDAENRWKQLSAVIGDIYKTLQNDIASGITGLINGTQSVSQAFLKMGQDIEQVIVNYIVKNLLLTQSNLNSLQQGILRLFGAQPGGGGGAGGGTGIGIPNAFGFLKPSGGGGTGNPAATFAEDGTTSEMSGGSGLFGSLGGIAGIANIANLGVSILSGIVSGVQQAHANNLLDEIEKSVRKTWVATGEAGDSISVTSKATSQVTKSMLDFLNGTLTQYLQNLNVDLDTIAGKSTGNFMVSIDVSPISNAISTTNDILNAIAATVSAISDTENLILQAIGPADSGPASRKSTRTMSTSITGIATPVTPAAPIRSGNYAGGADYNAGIIGQGMPAYTGAPPPTTSTITPPDLTYHLPGNDAGVPIGTNTALTATGANSSILNSILATLSTPTQENPNLDKFLNGQTFDEFLSGLTDVFGGLGINASSINTMFDSHLSQADFTGVVVPELRRDLSSILNAVGTPAENGKYSAEQFNAINSALVTDLKNYFTNIFPGQISSIQGSMKGDIISTPIHGSEAEQLQIQQALLAQKPALGEFPSLGAGGGPLSSNAFADVPAAVVAAATGLSGALSSAGDFVVTSFTEFQKQLDAARRASLEGAGASYKGGVGSALEAGSYTAQYLASQMPGYALTLPKSVTVAGSSRAIGYDPAMDSNRAQTAKEYANLLNGRTVTISINGNNFPVGMSPSEVAEALVEELRTKSSLLR